MSRRRRAFSFAEVMFAVVILGVGFIMIAGVFPVAIRQSKSTADETISAGRVRGGAYYLDQMCTSGYMPATMDGSLTPPASQLMGTAGQVMAIPPNQSFCSTATPATYGPADGSLFGLWQILRGNIISPEDPRYAWVPFYFRGLDANNVKLPYAQIVLICVQAANSATFTDLDVNPSTFGNRANLQGRPVRVTITDGLSGDPDTISFAVSGFTNSLAKATEAVAEGSFVIIRSDNATVPFAHKGRMNGRIYRVGVQRPDLSATTWELSPGNDFTPDHSVALQPIDGLTDTEAWIVGRSFANLNDVTQGFEGPAMDVSAYSTFVYCKP